MQTVSAKVSRHRRYRNLIIGRVCRYCERCDSTLNFIGRDECGSCNRARSRYGVCGECGRPHSRKERTSTGSRTRARCWGPKGWGAKADYRERRVFSKAGDTLSPDRPSVEWQRARVESEIALLPLSERIEHAVWANEGTIAHSRLSG